MKKTNMMSTGLKKLSAIFASALMAVSAMSITAFADDITDGVKKKSASIELRNVEGAAGGTAVVQVIPTTGNTCTCYDFLLEYNPRLELEIEDVAGANAYEIFEQDGKKYVSLVGFTTGFYEDGVPMATLNFHLPADANENDDFSVKMAKMTTFASSDSDYEAEVPEEAEVTAVTSSCENGLKTYQERSGSGMLMSSSVGRRGDVNLDGVTNVRDAAAVAAFTAGKTRGVGFGEKGMFLGDVDDNGILNVRDAAKIARYVAKGCVSWN